jgi:hypothetical protein
LFGDLMSRKSKLTDATKERIRDLAASGLNPPAIAALVDEHPSTVQWFMYSDGMRAPSQTDEPSSYMRNGRRVHRFTRAEDAFIEARRIAGDGFPEIARKAAARFGTERKPHSIQVRLIMLANLEVA